MRDIMFTLHTDGSCPELSNFFSHGASRRVTVLLSRDLSFGLTDQREVIRELVNFHTESHGESRDLCHELSNCRIFHHTENHGESRGGCHELSYFFLHTESHGESRGFVTRLVLWTH